VCKVNPFFAPQQRKVAIDHQTGVPAGKNQALLFEVGLHHVDHFIGRKCLLRIRFSLWVKHVPDVAFQEFSH
jgi:hypothetical protein